MSTLAVVGAGPQLGLSLGRRFARDGFRVALLARGRTQLDEMVTILRTEGASARGFTADVTDRVGLVTALADVEREFGTIDVLEYSPAPTPADLSNRPMIEAPDLTVEAIRPEMDAYLYGAVAAIGQVLPDMIARGTGTIITTSGAGAGPMVIPQVAQANVATAALRNWTLALHQSLAGRGVYAAHVSLAAAIGCGRPKSDPDYLAELYWGLHTRRDVAELFHHDLPDDFEFQLADKFTADPG